LGVATSAGRAMVDRPANSDCRHGSAFRAIGLLHRKARAIARTEVEKRRLRKAAIASPLRIVVGAGSVVQDGWTKTERAYLDLLDPKSWEKYFRDGTIDAILAEHVWEHLTLEEGQIAARTCRRFLKRGGYLRIAVPDGNHPDRDYIEHVRPGGSGPGAEDHKVLYEHALMSQTISQAGFSIHLLEHFDKDGRFIVNNWSAEDGMVRRSSRYDERNQGGRLNYTSLIIDARAV
jgi:predicted SAM-dependent methyltransferase